MDNPTETMVTATSGLNALVRTSFRLTFSPSPTIAMVSKKVDRSYICSITASGMKMTWPIMYVFIKLIKTKPSKNQGNCTLTSSAADFF